MKLVNAKYGLVLEFEENKVVQLVIENVDAMSDIVTNIYLQVQGGEGDFVLSADDGKELKFSKAVECILEPFSLQINSKKNLLQLYAEMGNYCNEMKSEQKYEIINKLINMVDDISIAVAHNIVFDIDITPDVIFKSMNVKFVEEYGSVKEKLIQYISVVSSLNVLSLLIFVNLDTFINDEDLTEICDMACSKKISILLISAKEKCVNKFEKRYIIDKDLCIIQM